MTIAELKELIQDLPDDMDVLIPLNPMEGFDGAFFSPCTAESSKMELGIEDLSEEDIAEYELLNKPLPNIPSFVLVPCGFFEKEYDPAIELN